jgi:hypothetical protein
LKPAWVVIAVLAAVSRGRCADDRLMDLFIKKGMLTQEEVDKVRAEENAMNTNAPVVPESKWRISDAIKTIELYGDIRFRYEHRQATDPSEGRVELDRERYALRLGLRGEAADNFYYGLRLETASNPRSPWVTFGTSSSGVPYFGPFGKSTAGITLGQIYIGWKPADWVDLTVGKMPNPIYTTPMVWDSDINPEGFAERFKYSIGKADFFATFGQFLYYDTNPSYTSPSFFPNLPLGQGSDAPFLLAWQGGVEYHFSKDVSVKVAPVIYNYIGVGVDSSTDLQGNNSGYPGFADAFVGEGANYPAGGQGTASYVGYSGYPSGPFNGFASDQTGINNLLVLEIPAEFDFKVAGLNARVFGDFAYNLEGSQRAQAAADAIHTYTFGGVTGLQFVNPIPVEANDNKAYQIGFAIANKDALGLVYGTKSKKNAWEFRTYWQHVEQYALDPNLMDSDYFEGRGNLQGIYAALAYGLTDNVIGTFRYGYAWRINDKLGTGGSNLDIPQVNPIDHYNLVQFDLTLRF